MQSSHANIARYFPLLAQNEPTPSDITLLQTIAADE